MERGGRRKMHEGIKKKQNPKPDRKERNVDQEEQRS
jgi:hypothetical protein